MRTLTLALVVALLALGAQPVAAQGHYRRPDRWQPDAEETPEPETPEPALATIAVIDLGYWGRRDVTNVDMGGHERDPHGVLMTNTAWSYCGGRCDVISYDIADGDDWPSPLKVVHSIEDAIEREVDVISISLAYIYAFDPLKYAVADALGAGIVVLAAAGNTPDGTLVYPAAYDATAVTAAEGCGVHPDTNRGPWVDLAVQARSTSLATARLAGEVARYGWDLTGDAVLHPDLTMGVLC